MKIKQVYIYSCLSLFISSSFADRIVTSCSFESGATHCLASESNNKLLDVKCMNGENGQVNCNGNYSESSVEKLKINCNKDVNDKTLSCLGSLGADTNFKMECIKSSVQNFKCAISDNSGESLTMLCSIDKNGMPNCSGLDENDDVHKINCNGSEGKSASCVTN